MGFLDKAAAKVGEATKAAQEGIADQQAGLRDTGIALGEHQRQR